MPDSAKQPDAWPTRKLVTMAVGTPTIATLIGPAVAEVWPQIVPAAYAGEAMIAFVSAAAAALVSAIVAYFVPDRPNTPET